MGADVLTHDALPRASAGPDDDLDAAAVQYAARVAGAEPDERRRLRDEFTTYCLPFARRLASRYHGRGEALEDLDQVARLGLVKAISRYDPERGSFVPYAVLTVRGEIRRHFRDRAWGLHVVRRLQDLGLEVRHATAALTATLCRTPTQDEIAEHLGVPVADVREAIRSSACYQVGSLNAPASIDERSEVGDVLGGPDPELDAVDDRVTVARLVRTLPEREQRMLAMRFFGNYTQTEIAGVLGVSQMQVSRLLAAALGWLREAMLNDKPPPWRGHSRVNETMLPVA
jgi:RNA polymerase sigma-B factor